MTRNRRCGRVQFQYFEAVLVKKISNFRYREQDALLPDLISEQSEFLSHYFDGGNSKFLNGCWQLASHKERGMILCLNILGR